MGYVVLVVPLLPFQVRLNINEDFSMFRLRFLGTLPGIYTI